MSQGLVVNNAVEMPPDPYEEDRKRRNAPKTFTTKSDFDKLNQFLTLDRKVTFYLTSMYLTHIGHWVSPESSLSNRLEIHQNFMLKC